MYFASWLTAAQKRAIADVAIASSELEAELERCIIEICRLWWPHGAVLLGNIRLEAKLGLFNELVKLEFKPKAIPDDFLFAYSNLRDLNTKRNTIIHGEWILKSFATDERAPGSAKVDMETKNIVARRRSGRNSPVIQPREVKKIADLISLNRELLHQFFWERFPDRVKGLAGVPTRKGQTAVKLREQIRKRMQRQ